MPYKDKVKRQQYLNEYKKRKRRERGLLKKGRAPQTEEERQLSIEHRKQWEKMYRKKWAETKVEKRLLYAARNRATKNKLDFDLIESDIVVPTHCPILGIPLVATRPRGDSRRDIASLDRIDPTKGYTKDNIEVISWLANTMKNNATPDLLIKFAKEILRRYT